MACLEWWGDGGGVREWTEEMVGEMSQWAERMRERRLAVKDLEASFTCFVHDMKSSGVGASAAVTQIKQRMRVVTCEI